MVIKLRILIKAMQIYRERIINIHRNLGIPDNYESIYALPLQKEESELVNIGRDIFGRLQSLSPVAAAAWEEMKDQAAKEGVILDIVSAFRGVDKQNEIILKKIESGQSIYEILKVCAAPGYSEHHTGRALDLTSNGCKPLTEAFENTKAFSWLVEKAGFYSFSLSYPRSNEAGISYEPWHWAYKPKKLHNKVV